jgi:uncharacterized protein YndB with AHSA1/START domain
MVTSQTATVTLPTDEDILIRREFDAPRDLVYRVYTEPDYVSRWWHAKRGTMKVCEIDLRPGGKWRYAMDATQGGFEVAFHGTYREVVPNERLVYTEVYEGAPSADEDAVVNTVTFTEVDGRTSVEIVVHCATKEIRDIIVSSGMEDGLQDALDLLEELAASME